MIGATRVTDPADTSLRAVAERLIEIAGVVANEAEEATVAVRAVAAEADTLAELARQLEGAAAALDKAASAQATSLAAARAAMATEQPAIDALGQSIATVTSISGLIASIATHSQLLALNARIEAARAGHEGGGFGAVAKEMSDLSSQTKAATDQIARRTRTVAEDVAAAQRLVLSGATLMAEQDDLLDLALTSTEQQRITAAAVATTALATTVRLDEAAGRIGRVGSAASAVKLLARQVARAAG